MPDRVIVIVQNYVPRVGNLEAGRVFGHAYKAAFRRHDGIVRFVKDIVDEFAVDDMEEAPALAGLGWSEIGANRKVLRGRGRQRV